MDSSFLIQAGIGGLALLSFHDITLKAHKEKPRDREYSKFFKLQKGKELRLLDLRCLITGLSDGWLEVRNGRKERLGEEVYCLSE